MFSALLPLFRRTSSDSDDATTVGDLLKEGEFAEKQLGSSVERRSRQLQRFLQGLPHCTYFVLICSSSEPKTMLPAIEIEEERIVATLIDHMKRNESLIYLVQRRKEYINNRLKEIDKRLASMNPAPPRQRSSCVRS